LKIRHTITLFLLFAQLVLVGQTGLMQRAEMLLEKKEYFAALEILKNVDYISNKKAIFNKGYCHFKLRELDEAESHFLAAHKLGHSNYELYFLMGQIRHAQGKYDEASIFYKQAFKKCKYNKEAQKRIINALSSSSNSEKMEFQPSDDIVINLGSLINSTYDEMYPLPSPSQDGLIYFSSDKEAFNYNINDSLVVEKRNANVYKALIDNNEVMAHGLANEKIQSDADEYLLDITDDGQILFYLQGDKRKQVFSDTFLLNESRHSALSAIGSVMRSDGLSELDVVFDSIFIFSSNKPGGYGGYDLYFTLKRGNTWLEGENLGPEINSSFDEVAPFLTRDGKHIYFSSNCIGGLGGYDVYKSGFSEIERLWSKPKNMRTPINSSQDELNFKISLNNPGTAFLSSNRLIDNQGGFDVYKIILSEKAWEFVINSPPLFFTSFMAAEHTQKIFKVASGNMLLPQKSFKEMMPEDSVALVQLETEKIIQQQLMLDSLMLANQIKEEIITGAYADSLRMAEWEQQNQLDLMLADNKQKEEAAKEAEELRLKEAREKEKLEREARRKAEREAEKKEKERKKKERDERRAEEKRIKEEKKQAKKAQKEAERQAKEAQEERERLEREALKREKEAEEERVRLEMETLKREKEAEEERARLEMEAMKREKEAMEIAEAQRIAEENQLQAEREEKQRLEEAFKKEQLRLQEQQAEQARQDSIAAVASESIPVLNFQTTFLSNQDKSLHFTEEIAENVNILSRIVDSYPTAFIELEGFYPQEGPSGVYDLYNSMKLAETVKQELLKKNVPQEKISIKGHGYKFNSPKTDPSDELHKRVLVRVISKDLADHIPMPEQAFVNEPKGTKYYNEYLTKVEGLTFRVEGLKMKRMLANKAMDDIPDIMMEQLPNERTYTYVFGIHRSFDDALALQRSLLLDYKLRAPIVRAYFNGSQITEQQARFIVNDHPELESYIRYLGSE